MLGCRRAAAVLSGLAAALAAGCGGHGTATTADPTATPTPPKLVVLLIVDQLPQWAFTAKRPALTHGFDRLLREGDWRTGVYPYGSTLTAPGHALLGTGEPPSASGIVANEWWDRELERTVKSVEDGDGVSAKNLRVPGLGDAVVRAGQGGKAVCVSLKDRAAILPLGREGIPIWFDRKHAAWATPAPRPWLDELVRKHPIAPRLRAPWLPLDVDTLAELTGIIDNTPGEAGEKGFGATFPHDPATTPDVAEAVYATPLGNTIVLEAALAAIDGEQLGADAVPDLLIISFSAHDYVGHGWGHESWESWDLVLRLDRELETFLAALDTRIGANNWALVLTSDHGGSPLPERMQGGRLVYEDIAERANAVAAGHWGAGTWIVGAKAPYLYFTKAAQTHSSGDQWAVLLDINRDLEQMPGIGRVDRVAELAENCATRTGDEQAICYMLDADRSGDLVYLPARGWIMQERDEPQATAHGSLQRYDREVPVILLPPGRTTHSALARPTGITMDTRQISRVVSDWLGITAPTELEHVPVPAPAGTTTPDDDPN